MGVLVLALLALAASSQEPVPGSSPSAEELARKELVRIEELYAKGQYVKAKRAYEKLAEEFPETEAGQLAALRSQPSGLLGFHDILRHGPSDNRVDVVIMGDGYDLEDLNSFEDLAKDVPSMFEHDRVYGEYFKYFNFIAATVFSEEEGLDGYGREAKTALGAHLIPGPKADHVWVDVSLVRSMLEQVGEHDGYAIVFVPHGTVGSGGEGVAAVGGRDPKAVLHEWGHAFAGLKDEYTDDTSYRGDVESWINVSDTEDEERVPWRHWLEAKVPGIGVYEGADGRVRGAFKPTASGCMMEGGDTLCPVCREAVVVQIHQHVDPLDGAQVRSNPDVVPEGELSGEGPHEFEVQVMKPKDHALDVSWWVLPASESRPVLDPSLRPRQRRGALVPIKDKPAAHTRAKDGNARFEVRVKDLEPGRYRVVCRVRDTTEFRGDRFPWVLQDRHGLLESERAWWLVVE